MKDGLRLRESGNTNDQYLKQDIRSRVEERESPRHNMQPSQSISEQNRLKHMLSPCIRLIRCAHKGAPDYMTWRPSVQGLEDPLD
jgi:hypothetical protein